MLGPEIPHPVSSDEDANVRARILKEFAALGVKTTTYKAFTCNAWRGFRFVPCATVIDIIDEVVPGEGKAIVLLAHYDSVPAGPGASDDGAGFASILETARALRARGGKSLHPVIAVITEGEEAGLLGAQAFLENPALKARVGAVVNADNRGTRGRSLLFQTSPGDSRLIDLYAKNLPFYGTSSLMRRFTAFCRTTPI
ncbi:MAG: M20/M25/M40 family metallo-hydrolase [Rhizomicrobium sp.]